jgi:hypothetical protein
MIGVITKNVLDSSWVTAVQARSALKQQLDMRIDVAIINQETLDCCHWKKSPR